MAHLSPRKGFTSEKKAPNTGPFYARIQWPYPTGIQNADMMFGMNSKSHGIGITFQAGKGWKKCIGWYQHPDGRRLPKIHWLGHDQAAAIYLAAALQKAWLVMQSDGPRGWTPQDVANAKAFIGGDIFREKLIELEARQKDLDRQQKEIANNRAQVGQFAFIAGGASPVSADSPKLIETAPVALQRAMLYGAIKAYVEAIKGKRKSDKHKQRCIQVVEVNLKRTRADCPLADVDFAWLDSLCDHFKSRPKNLKDGKPLSPAGVKNILTYLRLFFQWVDDASWGGWEAPRKLLKPFKMRIDDLMSPVELRAAGVIQQFNVPTLVKLYQKASDQQKAIMLTALFTGATQQELAVLEQSEFDLDAGTLHHFRNKTKIESRYWLPPGLVTWLHADFAKRPKDKLAFRTVDGNPLVTFKDGRQTSDAVRQMWDDLREDAELPDALSFKFLRKHLADWMMKNGGEAMAQIAMAHSRKTVVSKHYTSAIDFEAFNKLQKKMHAELTKADMFKTPEQPKAKMKKVEDVAAAA
jgi:integrase